jgi:hypothetical protein
MPRAGMPARPFFLLLYGATAFDSVETVVSTMKHVFTSKPLPGHGQATEPLLLAGVYASQSATCGLTGEEPILEGEERHSPSSGLCSGWSRGVCCSTELLSALEGVVRAEHSECVGCNQNLEATVCALVCSPEAVRPSSKQFSAELSAAFCETAQDACEKINPCERAVDIVSQFFGPISLNLVTNSPLSIVPPAEACEGSETDGEILGRRRTIPNQHRSSIYVMPIWREATSHALTTLVLVMVVYCVGLVVSFSKREASRKQLPALSLIGADALRPRLDVARL